MIRHTIKMDDYWSIIEKLVPEDLMSKDNMGDAKTLSKIFDEELTNFLGFETPLDNRKKARNDWSIAISCANRDRCLAGKVCRANAFRRFDRDESPFLDMSRCWGCMDCIPACPYGAVVRHEYDH